MLLTVLGCSGSIPGPNAAASGYLLEAEGFRMVVDLGNGTLSQLCDPFEIDTVLLTHLHPDHCADFGALTVLRRYDPKPPYDPRERRLPVYGPSESHSRLAALFAPSASELAETDLTDVFSFHTWDSTTVHIGPFEVRAIPVAHTCEAYGFRISHGGSTLAFTGDTSMTPTLRELADEVDTFLCEASWTDAPDRPPNLHLSGKEAGRLAEGAGVKRLLVTHIPPWSDRDEILAEARAAYRGEIAVATQGQTYEI